jgi:3-hydroxyisobutyrate dehydrogenase-like beta-hydroxyacid dehydrogenase
MGMPWIGVCASAKEAVSDAEVCFVCLYDEEAISSVLFGTNGALAHLPRRSILVLHSTVSSNFVKQVQGECDKYEIGLVCAPVSGSLPEAESGRLVVIAGAKDPNLVLSVRPLLEHFGSVLELPSAIAASQAKLLINAKLAGEYGVMGELMRSAQLSEIGATGAIELFERIACFSGRGLRDARFGMRGCPGEVQVPMKLLLKDLGLKSRSFDRNLGPLIAASREVLLQACANGAGAQDAASLGIPLDMREAANG